LLEENLEELTPVGTQHWRETDAFRHWPVVAGNASDKLLDPVCNSLDGAIDAMNPRRAMHRSTLSIAT